MSTSTWLPRVAQPVRCPRCQTKLARDGDRVPGAVGICRCGLKTWLNEQGDCPRCALGYGKVTR